VESLQLDLTSMLYSEGKTEVSQVFFTVDK